MNHLFNTKDVPISGIEDLDSQHIEIVKVLGALYNALTNDEPKEKIQNLTGQIDTYINSHFKLEENYCKTYNFSKTEKMKTIHKNFVKKFNTIKEHPCYTGYKPKKTKTMGKMQALHILAELNEWLNDHMAGIDKELVECIKKQLDK